MKTLLLADNQEITRAGLLFLKERIAGYDRVEEIHNRKELIGALQADPDAVVVLDYTLFDLTGADELIILQTRFSASHWILFSDELSEDFLRRVLYSSQAFSIVMKEDTLAEIQTALVYAYRSERFICQRIASLLQNKNSEADVIERPILTVTEKEILKAIALGKTTKEIAAERFSSIHTITTHRKNIFRKLSVNNAHEATKYALRAGIVDAAEYYI